MLDSLYEKALIKKQEIKKAFNQDLEQLKINPDKYWKNYSINETKVDFTISGGDGSFNQKRFMSSILYAVDAECLIYDGNNLKKVESYEVDILPPYKYVQDILRNYMSIFEIKSSYKALKEYNVDLSLFDGSILGNIIRPFPVENELPSDKKIEIKETYLPQLEELLENEEEIGIVSTKLSNEIDRKFEEYNIESMIYLENLENLLVLGGFLKETKNIVSISKTSTRRDYFELKIPDIAIFEKYCKKEGYSDPRHLDVNKTIKRDFPILNKFFRGLEFTVFYCRLENYKNVLKVELPFHASKKQVENILEKIKSVSAGGYPYLLKKAHNDVVIKLQDMEKINKILNLIERTGRDML
ncbi:MAG: DNA double-strand break repair nuclease NurA [Methanobacteriaceae archaeon]|jgi:NurA-like 5'-3' nuclease|nr:MAG: single-stranded DNA endonuclease [Methanobacterium sp. BRmetb2]MCC7558200.1 DNA double-strand break repair nuclease NurA [Methanobacteriaceae archaeon]